MSTPPKPEKPSDCSEGTPKGKGGKLARRARSFRDGFMDGFMDRYVRSPSGARAGGSPRPSPKHRTTSSSEPPPEVERQPLQDLANHVKQVQLALKHLQDVVSRNKLEVLPGNGTVVLETITTIHSVLKTYVCIDQSSALVSATNQVYQSLAKLIRLCDDVLLLDEQAISTESVAEVVHLVEEAVENLVTLASAKISERSNKAPNHMPELENLETLASSKISERSNKALNHTPQLENLVTPESAKISERSNKALNHMPQLELSPTHALEFSRSSLPDIPLTPREMQILKQAIVSRKPHLSLSSESILHDDIPPPKPPLPHRTWTMDSPPPLPPKRRVTHHTCPSQSLERLSLRSSSLGSMDSMLNSSLKDEDELQALVDEDSSINLDSAQHSYGVSCGVVDSSWQNGSCCCLDSSSSTLSHTRDSPDASQLPINGGERISSSSGFVSLRSSSQSYNYSSSKSSSVSVYESKTQSVTLSTTSSTMVQELSEQSCSMELSDIPPTLPIKQRSRRERHPSQYDNVPSYDNTSPTRPPPIPPKRRHIMAYMEMFGNCSQPNSSEYLRHSLNTSILQAEWQHHHHQQMTLTATHSLPITTRTPSPDVWAPLAGNCDLPPALPPKQRDRLPSSPPPPANDSLNVKEMESRLSQPVTPTTPLTNGSHDSPLDMLDISHLLVLKKPEEEGPDVRGGDPDALIVHATKANKNDFLYQEAFLTTYRTFLSPQDLIEKLCRRHERFCQSPNKEKQRAARESFSLLVRVVSDLTMSDFEPTVIEILTSFVYQLLCRGDLIMAKALRVTILDKYNNKRLYSATVTLLSSQNIYTRQASLLDFKSEHIAEQMTLLDSELFMKIEIPEVLIWAQEQNEERSPNLTMFTEHFNKMSYWARSRILEQIDAKDRERYVVKFIKIMKHLRKINNFNSYLALLSALDSAPIRRLEWQKHITEGLKEYCALIDSSSSFRAYRQALAETHPPCIPYIGLVLQDLTFVHIGNTDLISDGVINFSKRWQQFNIVENMKRFKKGTYSFKKSERIIAFFSNFDEYLCEEAMWQISEGIKPRGGKKAVQ